MSPQETTDGIIELLERVRSERRLSVQALCRKAHLSIYTYYHWIEGKTTPNIYNLSVILDALGLKLEVVGK